MHRPTLAFSAAVLLLSVTARAQADMEARAADRDLPSLVTATADLFGNGALVRVTGGPAAPWRIRRVAGNREVVETVPATARSTRTLATTDGGRILRRFGGRIYVVHGGAGTVTRWAPGGATQVYALGASSNPQDILLPDPATSQHALVTRHDDPSLLRLDLTTGQTTEVVDLSPLGGTNPISLRTMERDGDHLFVQVRVFVSKQGRVPSENDVGVLGVVDLTTLTLVDVDPARAGIQGIALQGAPPRLKMQILPGVRTLYVSTTESRNDQRGGIEMVDLDLWQSTGYALSEQVVGDLGGFVMTSTDEGFFVFHTDLLASTHLQHFTVAAGPDPGFEMMALLGAEVDVLAYDARTRRIYLPSGGAGPAALYAFDARPRLPVEGETVSMALHPHDVLVGW